MGQTVASSALPAMQNDAQNAKSDPTKSSIEKAGFGGVSGGVKLVEFGGVKSRDALDELLSELRAVPSGARLYSKEHHGNYYAVYRWFEERGSGDLIKRVRAMRYVAPIKPKRKTLRKLTNDNHKEIKSHSRARQRRDRRRG